MYQNQEAGKNCKDNEQAKKAGEYRVGASQCCKNEVIQPKVNQSLQLVCNSTALMCFINMLQR